MLYRYCSIGRLGSPTRCASHCGYSGCKFDRLTVILEQWGEGGTPGVGSGGRVRTFRWLPVRRAFSCSWWVVGLADVRTGLRFSLDGFRVAYVMARVKNTARASGSLPPTPGLSEQCPPSLRLESGAWARSGSEPSRPLGWRVPPQPVLPPLEEVVYVFFELSVTRSGKEYQPRPDCMTITGAERLRVSR